MTELEKIIGEKFNLWEYVVSRKEYSQNSPDGVTIETTYRQKRMTDPSIQELKIKLGPPPALPINHILQDFQDFVNWAQNQNND